jgi:EAL domain-containing protein (putative c-di-GMP-specific phosphodiesterase class I)
LSSEITGDVVAELSEHLVRAARADESRRGQSKRIRDVLDGGGPGIVFQLIVGLDSARILGYEALSRFADSRPPDRWFAEAESVGLRAELELHAAEAALEYFEELPPDSLLSINLSPQALGLGPCQSLARNHCTGIVFELTEHSPVEDDAALSRVLAEGQGFYIARPGPLP